ncbi:MAG: acetolactate synthase small subunit [Bacillota bacterium]|nr:acetolactate synthase small subunit [Bacillota bacterium]REJ37433.1 MAG: acetolactate synthase small subunit [Bacillota bacterium]
MQGSKEREHTLSVLVENRPGVLSRVAGLFSRRGFNIESIVVGTTEDRRYSRMTIVVVGDEGEVEQVTKQLHKLIDVIKISELSPHEMVERELALIKVAADRSTRSEILQIVDIFRASVIDVSERSLVIEVTGDTDKVKAMIDLLRPFGIKELVRTGRVAMTRGPRAVSVTESRQGGGLQAVGG